MGFQTFLSMISSVSGTATQLKIFSRMRALSLSLFCISESRTLYFAVSPSWIGPLSLSESRSLCFAVSLSESLRSHSISHSLSLFCSLCFAPPLPLSLVKVRTSLTHSTSLSCTPQTGISVCVKVCMSRFALF